MSYVGQVRASIILQETCSKFHPIYGLNHGEGVREGDWTGERAVQGKESGERGAIGQTSEAGMREE